MKTRIRLLMILVLCCLCSCADRFTRQTLESSLIKGKSTRTEVRALLGEPLKRYTTKGVRISAGNAGSTMIAKPVEVWLYSPHALRLIDLLEPEPLRVMFDANGVVTNYDFQDDDD